MASATAPGRRVSVAVEARSDRPDQAFTYLLPPGLGDPAAGSLLVVPYGRRLALGYLLPEATVEDEPEAATAELRSIEGVVSGPMLTEELLVLAGKVATYYRAPLGATIAAMLPPGLESRLERRWRIVELGALPERLRGAFEDGEANDARLRRLLGRTASAELDRLRRAGTIAVDWSLTSPQVRPRRVRVLRRLIAEYQPTRHAPLQEALMAATAGGERALSELAVELGVDPSKLAGPARRLKERGLAVLEWRILERDPIAHRPLAAPRGYPLADEQQRALERIAGLAPGAELLLQGVAAAGKTDMYLAAVEHELAADRGAILLVPEISLVPQLADRVRAIAGDRLAVLHSGLSAGERHDTWWRILRGEARVVVGTRMAVFAPLTDLGLIVIDEAHDGGYKSDRTPRFDARWAARQRARLTGARLVMGTATPDVVTIARVRGGLVDRVSLRERRVGAQPKIELVDMRAELAAGNRSIFSSTLSDALAALTSGRDQAVLLMNRRGAATFVLCRDCGESLRCPDCDLPFVYHLSGGNLRCHHCGRTALVPERCPRCDGRRIRYFGAGTQRVEAELRARYPLLRIGRLDSDALAARRGFEAVYDDFRDGRVDVLVGTQLAAKGLDLPNVVLAGVIAADVTLNLPDYLAPERTFQLLAQVAGRAGRGTRPGRVVVQTYAADHYAIQAAARLDVDGFADEELRRRRLLGYPPASVLARLMVADPDRDRASARASAAASAVAMAGVEVLGPLPMYVPRRAGRWRFQVVLRATDEGARAAALDLMPPGVAIDVDPESLL